MQTSVLGFQTGVLNSSLGLFTTDAGTETREIESGGQIDGHLKTPGSAARFERGKRITGRQPIKSTAKTETKHQLAHA